MGDLKFDLLAYCLTLNIGLTTIIPSSFQPFPTEHFFHPIGMKVGCACPRASPYIYQASQALGWEAVCTPAFLYRASFLPHRIGGGRLCVSKIFTQCVGGMFVSQSFLCRARFLPHRIGGGRLCVSQTSLQSKYNKRSIWRWGWHAVCILAFLYRASFSTSGGGGMWGWGW